MISSFARFTIQHSQVVTVVLATLAVLSVGVLALFLRFPFWWHRHLGLALTVFIVLPSSAFLGTWLMTPIIKVAVHFDAEREAARWDAQRNR